MCNVFIRLFVSSCIQKKSIQNFYSTPKLFSSFFLFATQYSLCYCKPIHHRNYSPFTTVHFVVMLWGGSGWLMLFFFFFYFGFLCWCNVVLQRHQKHNAVAWCSEVRSSIVTTASIMHSLLPQQCVMTIINFDVILFSSPLRMFFFCFIHLCYRFIPFNFFFCFPQWVFSFFFFFFVGFSFFFIRLRYHSSQNELYRSHKFSY